MEGLQMIKGPNIIKDEQEQERMDDNELFCYAADLTTLASVINIIHSLRSPMLKLELKIRCEGLETRVNKMHKSVTDEHALREHDQAEIKREGENNA